MAFTFVCLIENVLAIRKSVCVNRSSNTDPFAARQRVNLRRTDALDCREIKRVERFYLWEARLAQPLADDGLMPRGDLRVEDLVQIVFMRPVGIAGLARRALKDARDTRELEYARVGDDEIAGDGGIAHTASASQRS